MRQNRTVLVVISILAIVTLSVAAWRIFDFLQPLSRPTPLPQVTPLTSNTSRPSAPASVPPSTTAATSRPQPTRQTPSKDEILRRALEAGDDPTVRALLDEGAAVDAVVNGEPHLLVAVRVGRRDIVDLLLARGADAAAFSRRLNNRTALMEAAVYGHAQIISILQAAGAELEAVDELGFTALDYARGCFQDEAAAQLRQAGAIERDVVLPNPLLYTPEALRPLDEMRRVLDRGARIRQFPSYKDNVMTRFVRNAYGDCSMERLELLLEYGADVRMPRALLHRLIDSREVNNEVVQRLINAGADVNDQVDAQRRTPLHVAASRGNAAVVTMLLQAGADPLRRNKDGRTPAEIAKRSPTIVKLLTEVATRHRDASHEVKPDTQEATAVQTLALVPMTDDTDVVALLEPLLGQTLAAAASSVQMVERQEIARVLRENALERLTGDVRAAMQLGQWLRADLLITVSTVGDTDDGPVLLQAFEVSSGVVTWSQLTPRDAISDGDAVFDALMPRLRAPTQAGPRRYVGVLGILPEEAPQQITPIARLITALVQQELTSRLDVTPVERQALGSVTFEKQLTAVPVDLRTAATWIDGGIRRDETGRLRLTLRTRNPGDEAGKVSTVNLNTQDIPALRQGIRTSLDQLIGTAVDDASGITPNGAEAMSLALRAKSLAMLGQYEEAMWLTDAAMAIQTDDEEALLRLAYLNYDKVMKASRAKNPPAHWRYQALLKAQQLRSRFAWLARQKDLPWLIVHDPVRPLPMNMPFSWSTALADSETETFRQFTELAIADLRDDIEWLRQSGRPAAYVIETLGSRVVAISPTPEACRELLAYYLNECEVEYREHGGFLMWQRRLENLRWQLQVERPWSDEQMEMIRDWLRGHPSPWVRLLAFGCDVTNDDLPEERAVAAAVELRELYFGANSPLDRGRMIRVAERHLDFPEPALKRLAESTQYAQALLQLPDQCTERGRGDALILLLSPNTTVYAQGWEPPGHRERISRLMSAIGRADVQASLQDRKRKALERLAAQIGRIDHPKAPQWKDRVADYRVDSRLYPDRPSTYPILIEADQEGLDQQRDDAMIFAWAGKDTNDPPREINGEKWQRKEVIVTRASPEGGTHREIGRYVAWSNRFDGPATCAVTLDNHVVVGTSADGVVLLDESGATSLDVAKGAPDTKVLALEVLGGSVYALFPHCIARVNVEDRTFTMIVNGRSSAPQNALEADTEAWLGFPAFQTVPGSRHLLFTANQKLWRIDPEARTVEQVALPGNLKVKCINTSPEGLLVWCDGAARINGRFENEPALLIHPNTLAITNVPFFRYHSNDGSTPGPSFSGPAVALGSELATFAMHGDLAFANRDGRFQRLGQFAPQRVSAQCVYPYRDGAIITVCRGQYGWHVAYITATPVTDEP